MPPEAVAEVCANAVDDACGVLSPSTATLSAAAAVDALNPPPVSGLAATPAPLARRSLSELSIEAELLVVKPRLGAIMMVPLFPNRGLLNACVEAGAVAGAVADIPERVLLAGSLVL